MRIEIEHITRYRFSGEASYSVQSLRLTPSEFAGQRVIDWTIACQPDGVLTPTRDGFGNLMHLLTIEAPHRGIAIIAHGTVEVEERHGVVQGLVENVPLRVFLRRTALTRPDAAITALAESIPPDNRLAALHDLMGRIRDRVDYVTGVTESSTTASEALAAGNGVCQDHAHIFIAAARAAGIPARYITGYLVTAEADSADAHHAWAEAWIEGLGWVGFDVANRLCPTDHYVRIAGALDANDAAPIRGSRRGGGAETLEVEVMVQQQQGGQQ
jgi:transglutaminase-like putative cysteine protease